MRVHSTGIGRTPRFSWRDGKLLVESAPSVVDELARRIEVITSPTEGVPVVASVDRLTVGCVIGCDTSPNIALQCNVRYGGFVGRENSPAQP